MHLKLLQYFKTALQTIKGIHKLLYLLLAFTVLKFVYTESSCAVWKINTLELARYKSKFSPDIYFLSNYLCLSNLLSKIELIYI